MTTRMIGVIEAFAASEEASAVFDGVGDEVFELGKTGVGNGGADVDDGVWRAGEDRAWAEILNFGFEVVDETVVDVRKCNNTLNTNAILTSGLENPTHENAGHTLEVAVREVIEDDCWVFATQLDAYRCQRLCSGCADMVCDWPRTDECDVRYGGVGCKVVSDIGPANN
jgi:hypothetical protein